ncbi:hypothetical protein [Streptomyces sp. MST-110588]|uniref:hypothetical protein n=1 Tax=Streptomyces sp. MST-110588 TaxID=2833628 RepID=UPI001F5CF5B9|nr:hypothetical protein [Streptomyces sp. MST-110588]UNO38709.1 hypothetical protein KGS77_02405 [Streptomyces sp. MST-110588]
MHRIITTGLLVLLTASAATGCVVVPPRPAVVGPARPLPPVPPAGASDPLPVAPPSYEQLVTTRPAPTGHDEPRKADPWRGAPTAPVVHPASRANPPRLLRPVRPAHGLRGRHRAHKGHRAALPPHRAVPRSPYVTVRPALPAHRDLCALARSYARQQWNADTGRACRRLYGK